jgi:hypothetical protein
MHFRRYRKGWTCDQPMYPHSGTSWPSPEDSSRPSELDVGVVCRTCFAALARHWVLTNLEFLLLDIVQGCCRSSPLTQNDSNDDHTCRNHRRRPNLSYFHVFIICIHVLLRNDGIMVLRKFARLMLNMRREKIEMDAVVFGFLVEIRWMSGQLRQ